MKLYLVQHGEAVTEEVNPKRPLTKKGRRDVTKIARFLKDNNVKLDIIWHSTKMRAIETAQIIAGSILPKPIVEEKQGLAPNDSVNAILEEIAKANKDLMIVGHLPFLQKLVSLLFVGVEYQELIGFRQGGVVCLERKETRAWQIMYLVIPEFL